MNALLPARLFHRLLWLAVILCADLTAQAESSVRWTTNYYSVTGSTVREIRESIRANRPWKERFSFDAMTDWRVNWSFNVVPTADGCRCAVFTTQTSIVITMPRWIALTNAPAALRERWSEFQSALGRHEATHAAIALSAAGELHKRVKALGPGADCDQLKGRLDDTGRAVLDEFRARDKVYDKQTRHGATEGAVLSERRRDHR